MTDTAKTQIFQHLRRRANDIAKSDYPRDTILRALGLPVDRPLHKKPEVSKCGNGNPNDNPNGNPSGNPNEIPSDNPNGNPSDNPSENPSRGPSASQEPSSPNEDRDTGKSPARRESRDPGRESRETSSDDEIQALRLPELEFEADWLEFMQIYAAPEGRVWRPVVMDGANLCGQNWASIKMVMFLKLFLLMGAPRVYVVYNARAYGRFASMPEQTAVLKKLQALKVLQVANSGIPNGDDLLAAELALALDGVLLSNDHLRDLKKHYSGDALTALNDFLLQRLFQMALNPPLGLQSKHLRQLKKIAWSLYRKPPPPEALEAHEAHEAPEAPGAAGAPEPSGTPGTRGSLAPPVRPEDPRR